MISLDIVALPTVCSLEVFREVNSNTEAKWIMQSIKEDKVPSFDVGLDGQCRVAAILDTGIDLDDCYFHNEGSIPTMVSILHNAILTKRFCEPFSDKSIIFLFSKN